MKSTFRVLVLGVVVGLVAVPSAAADPSEVLASAIAAARLQQSARIISDARLDDVRVKEVTDASQSTGIQRIAYTKANRVGHATVIVTSTAAYVRGDAFVLVNFMGYRASPAAKFAGRWIRVPAYDSDYSALATGVTLSSAVTEIGLRLPLRTIPDSTVDGKRVAGIAGVVTYPSGNSFATRLYVRKAKPTLPVMETQQQGTKHITVTFSRWDEPVRVTVPARAVSIAAAKLE